MYMGKLNKKLIYNDDENNSFIYNKHPDTFRMSYNERISDSNNAEC